MAHSNARRARQAQSREGVSRYSSHLLFHAHPALGSIRRVSVLSDNHLCNTLAAESLATHKLLALHTRKRVEGRGHDEGHGGGDQAGGAGDQTGPLDGAEDGVHASAHPVGREATDEGVEGGGGRADAEEEGHLNEEDDE